MSPINYESLRALLEDEFSRVERDFLEGSPPAEPNGEIKNHFDVVFMSRTQAYREVYLGCILARLSDKRIDVTTLCQPGRRCIQRTHS